MIEQRHLPVSRITCGPKQHFFGYYDKRQFDPSGRYALGLECDVIGRLQRPDDVAVLGLVDLEQGNAWRPLAETRAWNWQMGCLAQWLPGSDTTVIYNDRRDGRFVAVVHDVETGEVRTLPRPVAAVSPDGRSALSLNFVRLWPVRPETGYCGGEDPWADEPAPREDGLHSMDLATDQHRLIISLRQMAELQPTPSMAEGQHYFTHPTFNEAGTRFFFWHRWQTSEGRHTRLYAASPDGTDICLLWDKHSHSTWLGNDRILAFVHDRDGRPRHWLFTDHTAQHEAIGEGVLTMNGHFTYSPDKRWLLTDKAPGDDGHRRLHLYHLASERLVEIGRFHSMPELAGPLRCDLHPRWSPDGTKVCIDSTHEGSRQMYVADVGEIVRSD